MYFVVESDGPCAVCPRLKMLLEGVRLISRAACESDGVPALEARFEGLADGVCAGCSREEPVAILSDGTVTLSLFPQREAA